MEYDSDISSNHSQYDYIEDDYDDNHNRQLTLYTLSEHRNPFEYKK